ncbi:uncharacterized protein [Dendrobates tinctorius]|uniref:uncharacterized protein n=1 Tax=Dendrobates tinctorius TaxID=92724 RepID=UPI003CC9F6C4
MKDSFNTDVRAEGQVRSGSAARTRTKYRYHRALEFLRPVLAATRATWSSTLQTIPRAVLHRSTSDPSQPSDSQEATCRSATQTAGDQEAGQSVVPLSKVSATGYAGTTRQRQRASDRPVLPEFMHLSEAFHASLKSLSESVESVFSLMERGFNHMEHLFHSSDQHLDRLEADLNTPAHHFFSKIERGMAGHLSPEQQLNVLHACNTAYLQVMQQNQYVQQSVLSFPPVPPLTHFTTVPTSAAYHCTAPCIPSQAGHHYTTPMPSAAGHSTPTTTMASAAPVWSTSTATVTQSWRTTTAKAAWATATCSSVRSTDPTYPGRSTATTQQQYGSTTTTPHHSRSTATTPHQRSTATTSPPRSTATTPHQRSTANTSPHRSTATTSPTRSNENTSPRRSTATTSPTRSTDNTFLSRSTDTTYSPSRNTTSATTEQQRGDQRSIFFSSRTRSNISRRSTNVKRSHGGSRSRQLTPAPKKTKKQKTLFASLPSPSNVSQPASISIPELPSSSTFVAPSPRTPSSISSHSSSLHIPKVAHSSPKRPSKEKYFFFLKK